MPRKKLEKGKQSPLPQETVSYIVIPAKPRETGPGPGSRSQRNDGMFLDSGSRYASRRSSGMTAIIHCGTISGGRERDDENMSRISVPEH